MYAARLVIASSLVLYLSSWAIAADPAPALVTVTLKSPLTSVMGELGKEDETDLEVLDLETGKSQVFKKSSLLSVNKSVADSTAVERVGLPAFLAWRISKALPLSAANGKVAQVDGDVVYVSLGANAGMEIGKKLLAYRDSAEIKDPDTGELLGRQRLKVAQLKIVEVQERLSKAMMSDAYGTQLEIGDVVELADVSNALAIFPVVTSDGSETETAKRLSEELTTGLVNRGVSVVERRLLDKVLAELGLQKGVAFDADKSQAVGKQLGAYAVLVGTIAPKDNYAEAHFRVVRVETGEILAATTQKLFGNKASMPSRPPTTPAAPLPSQRPRRPLNANAAIERAAAEWVLSRRGKVELVVGAKPPFSVVVVSEFVERLPKDDFVILKIDLPDHQIADSELINLEGLSSLQNLSLRCEKGVSKSAMKYVAGLPTLLWLDLRETQVADDALEEIGKMTQLMGLVMQKRDLSDSGILHFQKLVNLKELILIYSEITDKGLVALRGLKNLTHLRLQGAKIGGSGLENVKGLRNLSDLNLSGTNVSDEGLKHLRGLGLRDLDLYGTQVTDVGLQYLTTLRQLEHLTLTNTPVSDAGVNWLKASLPRVGVSR